MERKKHTAHLVKTKDVVLENAEAFAGLKEASIDTDNFIVKDICIANSRKSQNGYEYSDKSFNTLTHLAEGARCFLDHPSVEQTKQTGGVRPIHDFAGVFHHARRSDDRVSADLYVRESVMPLFQDIATLSPDGMGLSINSRCKVYVDDTGKESVVDIDALHSVDLVSSASLTKSLWESLDQKELEDLEKEETTKLEQKVEASKHTELENKVWDLMIRRTTYHDKEIMMGIIHLNEQEQDRVRSETTQAIYHASEQIFSTVKSEGSAKEKEEKIEEIFDTLDDTIQSHLRPIKEAKKAQLTIKINDTVIIPNDEEE